MDVPHAHTGKVSHQKPGVLKAHLGQIREQGYASNDSQILTKMAGMLITD